MIETTNLDTYRGRSGIRCGLLVLLVVMLRTGSAIGQTSDPLEQPVFGSTLTADLLGDLPTSNNPFAVPENFQPETIGDRFSAGGLNVATAPRFGGFLNSWTQTQFRIGDVSIADPRDGGTPLLLPTLFVWERLTTMTAAMGVDESAPGLSMTLEPARPRATWFRAVEGWLSGSLLSAQGAGPVPLVDSVREWQDGHVLVSGPLTDRVGLVAAGSWRRLSHVAAPAVNATEDRVGSGFAHLVWAATPRDEVRVIGWAQRAVTAPFTDTGVHVQSTWERRVPGQLSWRVFGGYTERSRSAAAASNLIVDSLTSDPVSDLFEGDAGTARRWVVGARMAPRPASLLPTAGVEVEGARLTIPPTGVGQIRELVNGSPARLWLVRAGAGDDSRGVTTVALFGNERITAGRVTFDAGVRLETLSGAADASAHGIQWTSLLPRTMLRWRIIGTRGLEMVASYRRSAYQLPLNTLAIGDAAAPVADVSTWNGVSAGPLIARVGPGTGGDAAFTQIDPQLRRPTTDEVLLAFESRPIRGLQLEAAGIAKREESLLGLADVGSIAYTSFEVPDSSFEPGSPQGGPRVTVFNRAPGSYGRDRYLLTNQTGNPATFWGVDANIRASAGGFVVLLGATIWAKTVGPAAAVGFLPTENDQDLLGNLMVDPNAATAARGQLFPDRSHTVKLAAVYRLPWRIRFGALARYQDGQPFARLVIVPGLTQGTTAVRAYVNGGTAFTYTGTLDIRVQKTFTTGRAEVAALVDVYNLPNLGNEVTEHVVSGPAFRTPTELQPSRTALVGVRVTF